MLETPLCCGVFFSLLQPASCCVPTVTTVSLQSQEKTTIIWSVIHNSIHTRYTYFWHSSKKGLLTWKYKPRLKRSNGQKTRMPGGFADCNPQLWPCLEARCKYSSRYLNTVGLNFNCTRALHSQLNFQILLWENIPEICPLYQHFLLTQVQTLSWIQSTDYCECLLKHLLHPLLRINLQSQHCRLHSLMQAPASKWHCPYAFQN